MSPLWSDRKCSCTVLLHFCVTQLLLPTSITAQTCSLDYFFFPLEDSENRAKNDLWIDASFCITFTVSMPQTSQADKSMERADMKRLNKCSPLPTRWQTHYVCPLTSSKTLWITKYLSQRQRFVRLCTFLLSPKWLHSSSSTHSAGLTIKPLRLPFLFFLFGEDC